MWYGKYVYIFFYFFVWTQHYLLISFIKSHTMQYLYSKCFNIFFVTFAFFIPFFMRCCGNVFINIVAFCCGLTLNSKCSEYIKIKWYILLSFHITWISIEIQKAQKNKYFIIKLLKFQNEIGKINLNLIYGDRRWTLCQSLQKQLKSY